MHLSCTVMEIWRLKDNGGHEFDLLGSRDVVSHVTIRLPVQEPSSYGWSIETGCPTKLFTSGHGSHFVSNIEFSGCTNVYYRIFNFSKKYLIFDPIF